MRGIETHGTGSVQKVGKAVLMLVALLSLGACMSSYQLQRAFQNGAGVQPQLGDLSVGYGRHLHFMLGPSLGLQQAQSPSAVLGPSPAWPQP